MKKKNKVLFFFTIIGIGFFIFFYYKKNTVNNKKTLTILSWMGTFDPKIIREFEEKSGIRVYLSYYSNNEELLSKMKLTKGQGIDLIIPSDYAIQILEQENLIQPLICENIFSIKYIYKKLINNFYIDNNRIIAIPIEWGVYGIAYTPKVNEQIDNQSNLIDILLGNTIIKNQRICMSNDSMAVCTLIHMYYVNKFKNAFADNNAKYTILYEILKKQHPYVKLYSDNRIAHVFEKNEIDLAYIQTDEFIRALEKNEDLNFNLIPSSTIKTAEYIALSAQAKNISESYEFINYILSLETMEKNIQSIGYFPVRKDFDLTKLHPKAQEIINNILTDNIIINSVEKIISDEDRISLWTALKSRD
jgi:spermidine/putrescine transport system substrate-binding protein